MVHHHHRSAFKRNNKPYKGKSKGKVKARVNGRVESIHVGINTASKLVKVKEAKVASHKAKMHAMRMEMADEKRLRKKIGRVVGVINMADQEHQQRPGDYMVLEALGCQSIDRVQFVEDRQMPLTVMLGGSYKSMMECLDIGKVAEVIVLVFDANQEVSADADQLITLLFSQGLPTIVPVIVGVLDKKDKKGIQRYVETVFAGVLKKRKIKLIENLNLLKRAVQHVALRENSWRESRPYVVAEAVKVEEGGIVVQGRVRGGKMSANRLVHLTGFGDFEVVKIETADGQAMLRDDNIAQDLEGLNIRHVEMLQDEEDEFGISDDEKMDDFIPKPKDHTSAWMQAAGVEMTEDDWADDLKKDDHVNIVKRERDEMEFPDEIDTPSDCLAKDSFSEYRGLESFTKSEWEIEDLPDEYSLIYRFRNFEKVGKKAFTAINLDDGVPVGEEVRLYVKGVTPEMTAEITRTCLCVCWGLLDHERKVSVLHYRVKRADMGGYEDPVSSAEPILIQNGFRRMWIKPVYSEEPTPKSKRAKFENFFLKGKFVIASFYGRLTFGNPNVVMFKPGVDGRLEFLGTGNFQSANPEKLLLKRIILTGYPYRVNRRRAVLRYMFWNPEDVKWFRPVQLWTKYGLRGQIDEPLGTKGLFKATFDNFIKQNDTVCLSLYKREFPPFEREMFEGPL